MQIRRKARLFWSWGFWSGLLLGVLLTGASVLTCGPAPDSAGTKAEKSDLDDIVVARIGKRQIRIRDVTFKMKVQYPAMLTGKGPANVENRRSILNAMVDQYCWVVAGERQGLDKDEEFRSILELSRMFILANHASDKLVYQKAVPPEADMQKYYDDNLDQFRLVARAQVSLILASSRDAAVRLRQRALAGEGFAALARAHSTDTNSKESGGVIGTVTTRSTLLGFGLQPELNQGIMALRRGEISQPVQTSRGWALFRCDDRTEERFQPYDEVKETIKQTMSKKLANALFTSTLDKIKKETGAAIDDTAWMRYVLGELSEDEVFQMAQQQKDPKERVRYYQALYERYPQGARGAQALFMAGFTYAENLKDYAKARDRFQALLKAYPQNELAASAQWMLDNMEKGLESLPYIEQIKRRATGN